MDVFCTSRGTSSHPLFVPVGLRCNFIIDCIRSKFGLRLCWMVEISPRREFARHGQRSFLERSPTCEVPSRFFSILGTRDSRYWTGGRFPLCAVWEHCLERSATFRYALEVDVPGQTFACRFTWVPLEPTSGYDRRKTVLLQLKAFLWHTTLPCPSAPCICPVPTDTNACRVQRSPNCRSYGLKNLNELSENFERYRALTSPSRIGCGHALQKESASRLLTCCALAV